MCGAPERSRLALAADHETRLGHRPGDDPEHAFARGRRALSVHDHLAAVVLFLPGEVMVVLDIGHHLGAQRLDDLAVHDRMVRRGVLTHQAHRRPILLAELAIELEPHQVLQLLGQLGVPLAGELRVVIRHRRAHPAASAMGQQRQILPLFYAQIILGERQHAPLGEVVARSARAELVARLFAAGLQQSAADT